MTDRLQPLPDAVVPIEPVATADNAPSATTGPMTPAIPTVQPADADLGTPGENEEERLDEALQESMGTSDPVSIKIA